MLELASVRRALLSFLLLVFPVTSPDLGFCRITRIRTGWGWEGRFYSVSCYERLASRLLCDSVPVWIIGLCT